MPAHAPAAARAAPSQTRREEQDRQQGELNAEQAPAPATEFGQFIGSEYDRWRDPVQREGMQVD